RRAIAIPFPFRLAAGQRESDYGADVLFTDMDNAAPVHDNGRHGGIGLGGGTEIVVRGLLAPEDCTVGCIEAGQNTSNPQSTYFSLGNHRCTARARMPGRRSGDNSAGRILRLPKRLAARCPEAQDDFIGLLPGEDVEVLPGKNGRRITLADYYLPSLGKVFRPSRWRGEPGDLSIPIWPSPLRPVLGEQAIATDEDQSHHRGDPLIDVLHGVSPSQH